MACFPNLPMDLIAIGADLGSGDDPCWLESSDTLLRGSLVGSRRYLAILLRLQVQMCTVFFFFLVCFLCGFVFSSRFATTCPKSICNFPHAQSFWTFFFFVFFCQYHKFALGVDARLSVQHQFKQQLRTETKLRGMQVQLILFQNKSHNTASVKIHLCSAGANHSSL